MVIYVKFKKYFVGDEFNKSNCVIRSFCKLYNEDYNNVKNALNSIALKLNCNFNDEEVFETYMKKHNTIVMDYDKDIKIKDLKLDRGSYIIFCYDKKEIYHMVPIIDNVLYDKDNSSLELYVIKIYKKN